MESAHVGGLGKGPAAFPACDRDRSRFCDGPCDVGFGYSVMGESALARPSTLKAYQLRNRASDVERFYIDTLYDRDFTGNLERERRTLESWAESYPRDARPHGLIGGLALTSTGQYELSIAEADKAIALDPDLTPAYINKAINQVFLNRLDEALLTVRRATERKLQSAEWFTVIQYFVAYLKGADDELRVTATAARKVPLWKTPSRIWRRSPWLAPAACKTRGSCPRSPSRSRNGRVGSNGPACSQRPQPYGKRFTGTRPPPGTAPPRRSISEGAAKWTMPLRSRWPSQVICRNREPWPRISRASSPRIRLFNSCTCRRFGPCSH